MKKNALEEHQSQFFIDSAKSFSPHYFFETLLNEHHLKGHYYKNYPSLIPEKYFGVYKQAWRGQWLRNYLYLKELEKIEIELHREKMNIILLKGGALIQAFYADLGSRPLSDIDILIETNKVHRWNKILKKLGYQELKTTKWMANDFKFIHIKKINEIELVIEGHTKLFYHEKNDAWKGHPINKNFSHILYLDKEDMLLHLVGHIAFQHTFSKLFWLIDIKLFLDKYKDEINWPSLKKKAQEKKLNNSFQLTFWFIKVIFETNFPAAAEDLFKINKHKWWKLFFKGEDLWNGQTQTFKYFLLKHLTKDSLFSAFYYDFLWLKNKFFTFNKKIEK